MVGTNSLMRYNSIMQLERECQHCNRIYKPKSSNTNKLYCSWLCYKKGVKGKARKEYRISRGYKYKFLPDHPDSSKQGYIAEHRLVCEKKLGRRLKKTEVVHHINDDRGDNSPDNLVVCTRKEHNEIHDSVKNIQSKKSLDKMRKVLKERRTGQYKRCYACNKDIYVLKSHLRKYNFCSNKCVGVGKRDKLWDN